jgi:hypothetical protein
MKKENKPAPLKIALFGSAKEDLPRKLYFIAEKIGEEIAKRNHFLITGAARGISASGAKGAKRQNGWVLGLSPASNKVEEKSFNIETKDIDIVIHTGLGYKGRNIISAKTADAAIIINGGFGTLNEITIMAEDNKPIVSIKNTDGVANILGKIFKSLEPKYRFFYSTKNICEAIDYIEDILSKK